MECSDLTSVIKVQYFAWLSHSDMGLTLTLSPFVVSYYASLRIGRLVSRYVSRKDRKVYRYTTLLFDKAKSDEMVSLNITNSARLFVSGLVTHALAKRDREVFLVADKQLYKRLCLSVGRLICWSVMIE